MKGFIFKKQCDHFPQGVFIHDGIQYFACDADHVLAFKGDLVVNLTFEPGIKTIGTAYNIPELSSHLVDFPPEIVLAWPDMSRPPVKGTFWSAFHAYCKKRNYTEVLFHCQHGHGRTGTALAAMKIALQKKKAESAIKSIRRVYCNNAVESAYQIQYLLLLDEELNNRLVPEEEEDFEKLIDKLEPPRGNKKN
jgi:hypothetical protein